MAWRRRRCTTCADGLTQADDWGSNGNVGNLQKIYGRQRTRGSIGLNTAKDWRNSSPISPFFLQPQPRTQAVPHQQAHSQASKTPLVTYFRHAPGRSAEHYRNRVQLTESKLKLHIYLIPHSYVASIAGKCVFKKMNSVRFVQQYTQTPLEYTETDHRLDGKVTRAFDKNLKLEIYIVLRH